MSVDTFVGILSLVLACISIGILIGRSMRDNNKAIKGYPKDDETKKKVVEEINEVFLKYWGCPQKAINISMEAIDPADWDERITNGEIPQNKEHMMILDGEKQY